MIACSSTIAEGASPMPSAKTTQFALLDTAVYIENFRSGRFTFRLLQSS